MLKLGSLFDGSGTAPLAAAMCGIEPVWASEIEPYPIKVTKKRFPGMKHLGSILDINGADVEPVDIICGGSPCQDLSVAGKQKGLMDGERSHLFFEMTRIIKEMRDATNGKYPRYVIWENVPGAFSSNNGYDFLAVLQAFAEIADPNVYVPRPACKGNTDRLAWQYAGTIMGDGYSIAWRTVDAQYWGVPQRRRRIYLVAAYGGVPDCSGIDHAFPDFRGEHAGKILFERESMSVNSEQSGTPREETAADVEGCAGRGCVDGITVLNDQGGAVMSISNGVTSTLRAQEHGHQPVLCLQANGIDRADTAGCEGAGWRENESYTLNTIDRHAVAYAADCRNGELNEDISGTLQAKSTGGYSLNYQKPVVYELNAYANYREGCGCIRASGGDCGPGSEMFHVVPSDNPDRKYIVRRLTPLECCRLQGFPDYWTEGIERYPASDVPMYVDPTGAVEGSDSAKYKMWGNGMALPNMLHVMQGIVRCNDA